MGRVTSTARASPALRVRFIKVCCNETAASRLKNLYIQRGEMAPEHRLGDLGGFDAVAEFDDFGGAVAEGAGGGAQGAAAGCEDDGVGFESDFVPVLIGADKPVFQHADGFEAGAAVNGFPEFGQEQRAVAGVGVRAEVGEHLDYGDVLPFLRQVDRRFAAHEAAAQDDDLLADLMAARIQIVGGNDIAAVDARYRRDIRRAAYGDDKNVGSIFRPAQASLPY